MKQKVMSVMVFISVIVFSASLCSAGLFNKKNKKLLKAAEKKCDSDFMAGTNKCMDLIETDYAGHVQCILDIIEDRDKCMEPDQLKVGAKALKELKKIEKAEDKCKKSWEKGLKKCAKKKDKKQISCGNKLLANDRKCMAKAKKMRDKL